VYKKTSTVLILDLFLRLIKPVQKDFVIFQCIKNLIFYIYPLTDSRCKLRTLNLNKSIFLQKNERLCLLVSVIVLIISS